MNDFHFIQKVIIRVPLLPANLSLSPVLTDSFINALYIASPELVKEINKHVLYYKTPAIKESNKMNITLNKYLNRSKMRCTPFGLFSGIGVCSWGELTDILLNEDRVCNNRLDMDYLCKLSKYLQDLCVQNNNVIYYSNANWFRHKNQIRYVSFTIDQGVLNHNITEIEYNVFVEKILHFAKNGKTRSELSTFITNNNINEEYFEDFFLKLVNSQLLFAEIFPTVLGDNFQNILLNFINQNRFFSNELNEISQAFSEICSILKTTDCLKVKDVIHKIEKLLVTIPIEFDKNKIIHVDSYLSLKNSTLDTKIQTKLLSSFEFLTRIYQPNKISRLEEFKKVFFEKYGDSEIDLLRAFDPMLGIDYHNFDESGSINQPTKNDYVLHNILVNSQSSKIKVIDLSNSMSKFDMEMRQNLTPCISVSFSLPFESTPLIHCFSGITAANTISRFASGNKEINDLATLLYEIEEKHFVNQILAEVEHLPAYRMGNVMHRYATRATMLCGLSYVNQTSNAISLKDLNIGLKNGHLYLIDKKSRKVILPRITTAHNYNLSSFSIYTFLGDLQHQHYFSSLSFNWGYFESLFQYTPRAIYNDIILKPATWKFNKQDISYLSHSKLSREDFLNLIKEYNLPEIFYIVKEDQYLYIDSTSEIAHLTFLDEVKKYSEFTLVEYIGSNENKVVFDKQKNGYENEFIAFVENKNFKKVNTYYEFPLSESPNIIDNWLYIKLYSGRQILDTLLLEKLYPLIKDFKANGLINKWFFIRYSDPYYHLRLRIYIEKKENKEQILGTLMYHLHADIISQEIWRIQLENYIPEIDRYGLKTIGLCEDYFFFDSELLIEINKEIRNSNDLDLRWLIAIRLINDFMLQQNLEPDKIINFLKFLISSYGNTVSEFKKQLSIKYRLERKRIENILNGTLRFSSKLESLLFLKVANTNKIVFSILNSEEKNKNIILSSLVHMTLNRHFINDINNSEKSVYELLYLHYRSKLARTDSN